MALQFLLLGALAARSESLFAIVSGDAWDFERIALVAALFLYGLFLLLVIGLDVLVYIPDTPKTGKSLIYFEDIAALNYADFKAAAIKVNGYEIERQLLAQIHQVSKIASRKMRLVHWAFWSSAPSTTLGIGLLAWASIPAQLP